MAVQAPNNHNQPSPFYQANPLTLALTDNDGETKLLISDNPTGIEGRIGFTVRNAWSKAIYFAQATNMTASKSNHHFSLSFKPGVLSAASLDSHGAKKISLAAAADSQNREWSIAVEKGDYAETIYFLRKAASQLKLEKQATVHLALDRLTAAKAGGARGSRVQMRTNPALVFYDTAKKKGLEEVVGLDYEIVSHHGKKSIPLHIGFVGPTGNMVLNDGSLNDLVIRVTNTSSAVMDLRGDQQAKITLHFDTGSEHKANQLTDTAKAKDIAINVITIVDRHPKLKTAFGSNSGLEKSVGCTILQKDLPAKLGKFGDPDDHFDIELTKISTTLGVGPSNLYVGYSLPNYWDGNVVLPIQKTPLIYFTDTVAATKRSGVGIGNRHPEGNLHVGKDSEQGWTTMFFNAAAHRATKIIPELFVSKIDVNTDLSGGSWLNLHNDDKKENGTGALITFSTHVEQSAKTGHGNLVTAAIRGIFGDRKIGAVSGQLAFYTTDNNKNYFRERMRIDPDGNVGIGTKKPRAKLHILADKGHLLLESRSETGVHLDMATNTQDAGDPKPTVRLSAKNDGHASSDLIFYFEDPSIKGPTGHLTERLRIKAGGMVQIKGKSAIELGVGLKKEASSGKIAYQVWSQGLDIVGAGTKVSDRKIQLWAEGGTTLSGPIKIGGGGGQAIKKIIAGSVKADGTADIGKTYFKAKKTKEGVYKLTWVGSVGIPIVVVTCNNVDNDSNQDNFATAHCKSITECVVNTLDDDDGHQNTPFYFTAIWV